jgi:hypothetical protein
MTGLVEFLPGLEFPSVEGVIRELAGTAEAMVENE